MSNIVYVADFFASQVLGGGELNDQELLRLLKSEGYNIYKYNSSRVTKEILENHKNDFFIVSNFVQLRWEHREWLTYNADYIIYEHDHKYLTTRNPALYEGFKAPARDLRNYFFYKSAKKIICQSDFHKNIVSKNLQLNNIISVGGNLWSEDTLEKLSKFCEKEKAPTTAILDSNIPHKNTHKTVMYCKKKEIEYKLVGDKNYLSFLDKLSENQKFVFFPSTPETLSRVVCEARMMGMSVATNNLVGATQEEWFKLKGTELIAHMREKKNCIKKIITNEINSPQTISSRKKISIISTFYKAEKFLDGFIVNMIEQTMFEECELVLIDSGSPGKEKEIVEKYAKKYDNIKYIRYKDRFDPTTGLNVALQHSDSPLVVMALLDDRKKKDGIELLYNSIVDNKDISLVYGDCLTTNKENETFEETNSTILLENSKYAFSSENMIKCLPGPMPLWNKSMHDMCGFFDNDKYDYAADWDMWLRAVKNGLKFKKVNKAVGLYLQGGRSQLDGNIDQLKEESDIFFNNAGVFGKNYHIYREYFSQFKTM